MKKRSPQTVKHVIGLVKRIASFGQNKGLCGGLAFRPQIPVVDNKVTEDLTQEELHRLLEAIEADENRIIASMMRFVLATGMRRGELFRLKWADIDRSRGFIRIAESKGGKAMSIPLNDAAADILDRLPQTSPFVFPGEGGGQRVSVQKASKRIRERAGLPRTFRPLHGLRHVFASQLASSGQVDLYVLQRLLTHKSPVMTQRYAHLRDATLKAASAVAGDILTEAGKEAAQDKKKDIITILKKQ
jgi:integrase